MSPFLANVRVFDVNFDWPDASKAITQGVTKDGATIRIDRHSSSGGEYLAVPIVAIVFVFLYKIVKAIMAPFTQRVRYGPRGAGGTGAGLTQEEIAVVQKIQRTLSQMESRVESLETILIENARAEKKYGSKL